MKIQRHKETGYLKYITDTEFKLILKDAEAKKSPNFHLVIKLLAFCGSRVNETVHFTLSNFTNNFTYLIYIDQKTKVLQEKFIPVHLSKELNAYYYNYKDKIDKNQYFFFPYKHLGNHIKSSTVRMFFCQFRKKYHFNKPYFVCSDKKSLYRISPHTLKHYCAVKLYLASGNDLIFTNMYLAHKDIKYTADYIKHVLFKQKQEFILNNAFK